jgi:hypothetical protein
MPEQRQPAKHNAVRPSGMAIPLHPNTLPRHLWALLGLYFVASLLHFTHNAEYIAYYPNMPAWIDRQTVYLAWLAVTSIGVAALVFIRLGWRAVGIATLCVYGLFGLDGLLHYTLALCAQHTWAMNLTIWFEVIAGVVLAVFSLGWVAQRGALAFRLRPTE